MENKEFITYYGEYSLYHWIELILSEEIVLPDFQRCFVWDPKRVIRLMESFDKGLFVPPVIIANFSGDNTEKPANYVLDGQQRLSAVLLSFLKVFPDRFPQTIRYAKEDENDEILETNTLNWDFNNIQDIFRNKCSNKIHSLQLAIQNYKLYSPIDDDLQKKYHNTTSKEDIELYKKLNIDVEFLKTRYLGYSYIKAIKPNPNTERLLFGKIFKNINTSSVNLTNNESRAAMYWALGSKKEFFEPSFINNIRINNDKIDFARYMALLSNANNLMSGKCNISDIKNEIAIRYARSRMFEEYIVEYVESVSNDTTSNLFGKFSDTFPNYKDDLEKLKTYLADKPKHYKNVMEADFHLFGLFYWVLFKKKSLQLNAMLNQEILKALEQQKLSISNKKPNTLGAIRNRMVESINIYSKYLKD